MALRFLAVEASGRTAISATMTATYDRALIPKHGVVPTVAISTPAMAGPITRALFTTMPLRLIALDRSSGVTSELMNACRAGESGIDTMPLATLITTMTVTLALPVTREPTAGLPAGRRQLGADQQRRRSTRSRSAAPRADSSDGTPRPPAPGRAALP